MGSSPVDEGDHSARDRLVERGRPLAAAMQGDESIASIRARAERSIDKHQRALERLTALIGRPRTLYAIVAIVVGWVAVNSAWTAVSGRPAFDSPPFFWLQGCVALAALLMTTLILITANRQTRHAEERAHLELQVNLLTEEKVAKLIALVEELRRDLPMVRDRIDSVADLMQHAVDPHAVLTALESTEDDPRDAADRAQDSEARRSSASTENG